MTAMFTGSREDVDVAVVAGGDLEQEVRAARADVARLRLQLRTLEYEAARAEDPPADDAAARKERARDLCRAIVEPRLEARRAELAAELDREHTIAAATLRSARAEAAAIVAVARTELVAALLPTLAIAPAPAAEPATPAPEPAPEPAPPVPQVWVPPPPAPPEAPIPPMPTVSVAAPPVATTPKWRGFLYTDVLLPMLAALAVIVVLLAWFR